MSTTFGILRKTSLVFLALALLTICITMLNINLFLALGFAVVFGSVSLLINHTQENIIGLLLAECIFCILLFLRPSFFNDGSAMVLGIILIAISVLIPGKTSVLNRAVVILSATWVLFSIFASQHPIIFEVLSFAGIGGFIFVGILLVIGIFSIFQTRFDVTISVGIILIVKTLVEKLGFSFNDIVKNTMLMLIPLLIILFCSISKAKVKMKMKKSEVTEKSPSKGQG